MAAPRARCSIGKERLAGKGPAIAALVERLGRTPRLTSLHALHNLERWSPRRLGVVRVHDKGSSRDPISNRCQERAKRTFGRLRIGMNDGELFEVE